MRSRGGQIDQTDPTGQAEPAARAIRARRRPAAPAALALAGTVVALGVAAGAGVGAEAPSLDELLKLAPPATTAPVEGADPALPPGIDPAIARRLGADRSAELFGQVVQLMDEVATRLGIQHDPGVSTQRAQQSVLAKLDQLIADAEKQGGASAGGSGRRQPGEPDAGNPANAPPSAPSGATPTGTTPNRDTASPGRVERVVDAVRPLEQLKREWGQLPPRLRDQLIQGFEEPFSPIYQTLTERYYRRLAEEPR